ncbi:OBP3-responsive protein 1 [Wolffia australiana]
MAACGIPVETLIRGGGFVKQFWDLRNAVSHRRRCLPLKIRCFSDGKTATEFSPRGGGIGGRDSEEDYDSRDLGPVTMFRMSDFSYCDRVSIGLAGKGDELIFEAVVQDQDSPLYQSRVVLRQLITNQAQRRGWRALEVLKKLSRRQLMYHSYATQVYGYVAQSDGEDPGSFTLVHGYHGSYSLEHWLQLPNWLPTLEAALALNEEWVRRVGDDRVGGPAVTRQHRITRLLMRDLLIGVNYLHSHGLAHTRLSLENLHICPVVKHVKVGILGNAVDFFESNPNINSASEGKFDRRQHMIAFDMKSVGFIMAKMVIKELMDPAVFSTFKSFLAKGNDPSCLREHLLPIMSRNSPSGNPGLQMLDRQWGAGWNLLSLLLATKPSERISCLDALRHPFLCGPRWRIEQSANTIRWGLGSTAVKIAEEYIYGQSQRNRLAHFIKLMEMMNPRRNVADWEELLPGKWRLLYSTGRHIGLTLRQATSRVLIGEACLTFERILNGGAANFSAVADVAFTAMPTDGWAHDKSGLDGRLRAAVPAVQLTQGRRVFLDEPGPSDAVSLPAAQIAAEEVALEVSFSAAPPSVDFAKAAVREVRIQIPPDLFDPTRILCGSYLDARLLVLRAADGSALLFSRSPR